MKVIAIYSVPQECGSDYLDFVSLETGQVIKSVCMDGLIHYPEEVATDVPTGKFVNETFSTGKGAKNAKRFQIGYEERLNYYFKKRLISITFDDDDDDILPGYNVYAVYEQIEVKREYPYVKENDPFGQYLESIGIHIDYNAPERLDWELMIKLLSDKFGYEVVNVLRY